jgi:hypothetical protein
MSGTVILQLQPWDDLLAHLNSLYAGAGEGMLSLGLAIVIALVGWAVAQLAAAAMRVLLRLLRFNQGVRGLFGPAAFTHEPAELVSWAVYWVVLVIGLMLAGDTLGFGLSASVKARLGDVLPRVVAAGLLLLVGVIVAMVFGNVTQRFFETAGMRGGRLRGQAVTAVLSAFAVLIALDQLGFAAQFVMAIGLIALGAVALAAALAFGLGCRDLARDFVVEYLRSLDERGPQRPS